MQFSLFFFSSKGDKENKYRLVIDAATLADRLGLDAVWIPERHFDVFGGIYPSPSVMASALSMCTKNINIRAGSVVMPLHHPARVVEEWSMVDNLSAGRVGLSFASGWHAQDFLLSPDSYEERRTILFEHIEIFKSLWQGRTHTFSRDGQGNKRTVQTYPRPIQDLPPIWLTAAGTPATFALAGKHKMNLLTHLLNATVSELKNNIHIYKAGFSECSDVVSDPVVTLMLHAFIGESMEHARQTIYKPLTEYLKTALLLEQKQSLNDMAVDKQDLEDILELSFERYFNENGLFGDVDQCAERVVKLQEIGVTEIASLIDYGISYDDVMQSIEKIALVKQMVVGK